MSSIALSARSLEQATMSLTRGTLATSCPTSVQFVGNDTVLPGATVTRMCLGGGTRSKLTKFLVWVAVEEKKQVESGGIYSY